MSGVPWFAGLCAVAFGTFAREFQRVRDSFADILHSTANNLAVILHLSASLILLTGSEPDASGAALISRIAIISEDRRGGEMVFVSF